MLANKENGFTLIELLVVLLIIGILLGFATYSIRVVTQQQQNTAITQLKNQISTVKHRAIMLNWLMRIRPIVKEEQQRIIAERFDFKEQNWQLDTGIQAIILDDEVVNMDTQFLLIASNGFVTDSTICIDDACVQTN